MGPTMHKKVVAGKKTDARIGLPRSAGSVPAASTRRPVTARPTFRQIPRSVNELLTRSRPLSSLAGAIPAQESWTLWLRARLPALLAAHVVAVVPKAAVPTLGAGATGQARTELVVLADSGAWSTRLRYALGELHTALLGRDPTIAQVSVRVQPR